MSGIIHNQKETMKSIGQLGLRSFRGHRFFSVKFIEDFLYKEREREGEGERES